ncbi:hypothetical protein GCM10008024_15500 [Allgaiera indica]|uniref:CoA-transferase family III n=1 Tax=Allgaiera indica TaxID=765699 RepID=A0AAN4URG9_9RHOB|nr:hypothetical protein GCM10008024_15500 [Allgaiera indica]SDW81719.1 CoA-transferase family III [Allgaiera indica]
MTSDLEGVLVVSIEQAVAAPYLPARLAEAGARVIKIEREEGDFARRYDQAVLGQSAHFVWLNRGKESVCLDLRAPGDRAVLEAMLARADVFIQNLAPGPIERLGFAQGQLRATYPRPITAWISGYGDEGPYRDLEAYDLLVQAEVGLSAITGNAAGPARVGVSVADIACSMTVYQAVSRALIGRQATGRGRHVAVSLFHALADWMNVPYLQHVYGGVTRAPCRPQPSHHRALWRVSVRGWRLGPAVDPERARMAPVLRRNPGSRRSGRRRALRCSPSLARRKPEFPGSDHDDGLVTPSG